MCRINLICKRIFKREIKEFRISNVKGNPSESAYFEEFLSVTK